MSDPKIALRNLGGNPETTSVGAALPSVPPLENVGLSGFLNAVKQWMQRMSSGTTRALTVQDAVSAGMGSVTDGQFTFSPADDLTAPPSPGAITVAASTLSNMVSWNRTTFENFAYAEVWRGTNQEMTDAVLAGTTSAAVYLDMLTNDAQVGVTFFYRVRFVSKNGIEGGWNSPLGTSQTAELIDDAFIGSLNAAKINAGTIDADRLFSNTVEANLLAAKLGVIETAYIDSANITDAAITNAKIGGAIQSTNFSPTAGWQIDKEGTATFNGGSITVKSSTGTSRLEIVGDCIKVYEAGVLRVKIGNLSA